MLGSLEFLFAKRNQKGCAISVSKRDLRLPILTSSKHWTEASLIENLCDFGSFVALDFDAAFFDRAADATGFLHLFGEFLFFRKSNPNEVGDHSDSLSAASGFLTNDINPPTI